MVTIWGKAGGNVCNGPGTQLNCCNEGLRQIQVKCLATLTYIDRTTKDHVNIKLTI